MSYNPEIHHRRSIRLKGHDYAGGGVYFVTICAHRDAGNIFAADDVKEMVAREWESAVGAGFMSAQSPEKGGPKARPSQEEGGHKARPYVIMPDHFHALVALQAGEKSLGDVICAFKSRVVQKYIQGVKAGKWPRFREKIWHRNYYEMIVRTPEAARAIAGYIQMNPWRCVMDFGGGLRGMGNPVLWTAKKLGVLCSRNAVRPEKILKAAVYFSGFHSPMEREVFEKLLECKRPVIWCPAWGLERAAERPAVREALEENRLLILEMRNCDGDLAAAEQRNRFVMECADELWLPHVAKGGMLDRLMRELNVRSKVRALLENGK